MAYLEFMSRTRFHRITYFDGNVNEITKLSLVHKSIVNSQFDEYKYFSDVEEGISREPGEFYLPKPLLDQGFTMTAQESAGKESGDPKFLFPPGPLPEAWHGPTPPEPMWSLLPPGRDCVGGGCWNPSAEEYNTARQAVLEDMNQKVYFSMPYLSDTTSAVVVYLDGIVPGSAETGVPWQEGWEPYPEWASPAALRARFPKAKMILPIYTYQEGKNDPANPNKHWDDAHMWWEFYVLQYSVGTTLHIWSVEYTQFLGSVYDNVFTKSTTMHQFMQGHSNYNDPSQTADTIIFHMILGTASSSQTLCSDRQAVLADAIMRATARATKRILITEHNGVHATFKDTCAIQSSELESLVNQTFVSGQCQFKTTDWRYLPGEKMKRRNVMIVADRQPQGETCGA
jgi:hypothetical protein